MGAIDDLEAKIKGLLENRLIELFPGNRSEDQLAQKLASVMHANIKKQADGSSQAPNMYVIVANPATLATWHAEPRRLEILADALLETGGEAGLTFTMRPTLNTAAEASMIPGEIRVLATFSEEGISDTKDILAVVKPSEEQETIPPNAFIILQGTKIVPLTQAVINIGRRLDNQIVIDDPRVSRNHAQMRVIKGRFVIFDLDSTGGLFINGQHVSQSVLYPGDVISLAGVTLVFGQDVPPARQAAQESTGSVVSADRPTVFFRKEENHDS